MNEWEGRDEKRLAQLLVGNYYGDQPHERFDQIRESKRARANWLCDMLHCRADSRVLEVGSGMGFTSKHVAKGVGHLCCTDISESFLNAAKRECADVDNIEFYKLDSEKPSFPFPDSTFDAIFSDAVFIHLNIYDIYWYFSEFGRLAKKGARVYVNVLDASKMDLEFLSEMAGHYRRRKSALPALVCWNAPGAVVAVAARFGFQLTPRGRVSRLLSRETTDLLFVKRS